MIATAARISAYSAIVWPRTNSLALTYAFFAKSIVNPLSARQCRGDNFAGRSDAPAGLQPCPYLELAVDAGQQRGDRGAHQLVTGINDDGDRCKDQRILSHRLTARKLVCPNVDFSYEVHFEAPLRSAKPRAIDRRETHVPPAS